LPSIDAVDYRALVENLSGRESGWGRRQEMSLWCSKLTANSRRESGRDDIVHW